MHKKIAAVLCAAATFLTMSGCKKAPPGTLTGISISYSGMCYDDTYGFDSRTGHQTKLLIFFDDALKIRSFFITLFASTTIVPHF